MYILSIFAVILGTLGVLLFTGNGLSYINNYLNLQSVFLLLVMIIPILLSSNLLKDFNNAFRMVIFKKKEADILEIKRAIEAIELVNRASLSGAGFITLFTVMIILSRLDDYVSMGINLSLAIVSLLYAFAINIVLLPLKSKLKIMLMEYMKD